VAQKDQLDVLGCLTTTTHHDQRQQPANDDIDQREQHEIILADPASTTPIRVFERHRPGSEQNRRSLGRLFEGMDAEYHGIDYLGA
jgi:hypothetical protein